MGRAMLAGLTYAAMSPNVARVYLRGFAFGFASIAALALLPLVARDQVVGGALTYGALLGAFGVGAVGGAFLGAQLRARLSGEAVARIGFCGVALAAATAAASGSAWLTGAGLMAGGASWVLALSLFNTTVQLSAPRWVLGRALALYQTATFGGMAVGAWLWGRAAAGWGLEAALYGAAGAALLGAAIGLRLPLPRPPELSLDPLDRFRPPALAVDLTPRSGPVAVLIEYRIAEADLGEFHRVMAERQRIRRRDGARGWTFLRDVEDPELWYESYQTATWTDYLRLQSRPTQADAAVGERLRALHRGPERPRVHRMLVRQPGGGHDAPAAAAPPPDLP
jgi:MFS family permease